MSEFKELVIFYFSGTGNAKQVALWCSHFAPDYNIVPKILDISKTDRSVYNTLPSDSLIIIISPVHGFNFPKITLDFIRRFPEGKNKIVLMNTRAGMRIGKFVTPGLTGIAFMLSTLILKSKGHKIIGWIPFDMPSNWISIHPALREKTVKYLHERSHSKLEKYITRIFSGRKAYPAYKDLIQDILISPISILYYLFGRFAFAKSFYASINCDNCKLCIKSCPVNAIKEINDRPYWTFDCESCMKCMNACPEKAIETSHGLLVIVWFLASAANSYLIYLMLNTYSNNSWINSITSTIIFFAFLWFFYKLQQLVLGQKIIGRLIRYTSLTGYKFWGRYKSIPDYKWMKKNPDARGVPGLKKP